MRLRLIGGRATNENGSGFSTGDKAPSLSDRKAEDNVDTELAGGGRSHIEESAETACLEGTYNESDSID